MNILYVVSLYPCWSETFIVREINALARRGHSVHIVSLKPDYEEFAHEEALQNQDKVIYPAGLGSQLLAAITLLLSHPIRLLQIWSRCVVKFWRQPMVLAKTFATLLRAGSILPKLDDLNIDHIHAHWATYPSTATLLFADILELPFSFTSHAHDIFLEDHLIKHKIDKSKFSATISGYNKSLLQTRYGADPEKIHTVHCAIDTSAFSVNPIENRDRSILAVGRFDEIKGFNFLIEAIGIMRQNDPEIRCSIVGAVDGDLLKPLQTRMDKLGITSNVNIMGAQNQEVVVEMMRNCGVFVLPCVVGSDGNMDGIPVVLMEAMALGTPVVSTRVSGIPELIEDGKNGILVNPADAESLAQGILRVFEGGQVSAMVKAGRQTVEQHFNTEHEAQKLEALMFAKNVGVAD